MYPVGFVFLLLTLLSMSLSGFLQRFRGASKTSSSTSYGGLGVDPEGLESEAQNVKAEAEAALIWNHAGNAWMERRDRQRAVSAFLKSADIYVRSDMPVQAKAVFQKVLRADGKNLLAHLEIARLSFADGFLVESRLHYLKFASIAEKLDALDDRDLEAITAALDIDDDGSLLKAFGELVGGVSAVEPLENDSVGEEPSSESEFVLDDFEISASPSVSDVVSSETVDLPIVGELPIMEDLDSPSDEFGLLDISDFGVDDSDLEVPVEDENDFLDEIARESEEDRSKRKSPSEERIVVRGDGPVRGSTLEVSEQDGQRSLAELLDLEDLIDSIGDILGDEKK
jgi:hypothetical protein